MSRKVAAILRAHELAKKQRVRRPNTRVETVNEDARSAAEWAAFQHDVAMDQFNDIPDKLGKTGNYEPKSIHDPAPPSRFQMIRPKPRRSPDRSAGPDCELPEDRRRHLTLTVEDGSGRARGVIRVNPYSKRIAVSGFGLTERK